MTGPELLQIARRGRPNVRYALHRDGNSIAGFDVNQGRFVAVAGRLIDGKWYELTHEILIDGKPVIAQDVWVE